MLLRHRVSAMPSHAAPARLLRRISTALVLASVTAVATLLVRTPPVSAPPFESQQQQQQASTKVQSPGSPTIALLPMVSWTLVAVDTSALNPDRTVRLRDPVAVEARLGIASVADNDDHRGNDRRLCPLSPPWDGKQLCVAWSGMHMPANWSQPATEPPSASSALVSLAWTTQRGRWATPVTMIASGENCSWRVDGVVAVPLEAVGPLLAAPAGLVLPRDELWVPSPGCSVVISVRASWLRPAEDALGRVRATDLELCVLWQMLLARFSAARVRLHQQLRTPMRATSVSDPRDVAACVRQRVGLRTLYETVHWNVTLIIDAVRACWPDGRRGLAEDRVFDELRPPALPPRVFCRDLFLDATVASQLGDCRASRPALAVTLSSRSGVGNRLLLMRSAASLAILLNRRLVVYYSGFDHRAYYEGIFHNGCPQTPRASQCVLLPGLESSLFEHPIVRDSLVPRWRNMTAPCLRLPDSPSFFGHIMSLPEELGDALAGEPWLHPLLHQLLVRWNGECLLAALAQPRMWVMRAAAPLLSVWATDSPVAGLHGRLGDAHMDSVSRPFVDERIHNDTDLASLMAESVRMTLTLDDVESNRTRQSCGQSNCALPASALVVASDTSLVQSMSAESVAGHVVVLTSPGVARHSALDYRENITAEERAQGALKSVVDILLLGLCDWMTQLAWSKFSTAAAAMSGRTPAMLRTSAVAFGSGRMGPSRLKPAREDSVS
jgi:hypothetical protein